MELFLEKKKRERIIRLHARYSFPIKKLIIINILNYTCTRPLPFLFFQRNTKHEHNNNQDTISTLVQDRQYINFRVKNI